MNTSAWTPNIGKALIAPWRYLPLVQPLERGEGATRAFFIGGVMKACTKCGVEKELTEFSIQKNKKDGRSSWCKTCFSQYASQRYLKKHKEILEKMERYRSGRSPERKAEIAEYQAAYYQEVEASKRLNNPGPTRVHHHNYRASRKGVLGRLSTGLVEHLLNIQKGCCAACELPLEGEFDIDHIIALSKGGPNVDDNVQLLHPVCNGRKHAMSNEEFLRRLHD